MEEAYNPWNVTSLEAFHFYNCPECEEKYAIKEHFIGHAMISHQKARETLPEILNIQDIVPEIREEEKSATIAKPSVNQDFHEVEQESEECVEVYKCDLCATFFNSEAELMIHKGKGHRCEFCTVIYLSVQGKLNHLSDSHNFQCDQCRQIFRLKTDLKYHESQTHPRPKTRPKFNCNTCGKSFPSKEGRDHHMKKGSKKCNQLRKSLKSKKSDLKQRKKMKISKD